MGRVVPLAELESILADEAKLRTVIKDELSAVKDKFATPRVCQITHDSGDIAIEEPLGKLGDHRTLNFRFGDQRSIDELAGSGPVGDDTPALQPRK